MINEIYELYRKTLPDIIRSEETVRKILSDTDNRIISFQDGNKLVGVSVINKNAIYLLCVDKNFQNRGIGKKLLKQSEEQIAAHDFSKVVIGAGKDYIMPGIPMNNGAHNFFKKHGYSHAWGDCGCFDMSQSLADFAGCEHNIGDNINGITYRWADIGDFDKTINCAKDAKESFVEYYQDKRLYEKGNKITVLVAEKDNEILGSLHVCIETEQKGYGSVGCTTTMHKHRGKGIATNMVMLGTKHLKDINLKHAFLSYTYTYILGIYAKAGYKVCMEYFMGEKALEGRLC